MPAKYALENVRRLAKGPSVGPKVIARTLEDLGSRGVGEALAHITGVLERLTDADFCETQTLPFRPAPVDADIYAYFCKRTGPWYVKFAIVPKNSLAVFSCHAPEHPLRRADGSRVDPP